MGEPSSQKPVDEALVHQYHFGQVCQPFHLFDVTTLQTQVPCVGIGYRASPCSLFGSERSDIGSSLHTQSGATTSRMPPGPHIVLQMLPSEATLPYVKERTVSLVSLGRRGSPPFSSWLGDGDTLSVGFTPWMMPSSNVCHYPLTSLLRCCPLGNSRTRESAHIHVINIHEG